MKSRIKRQDIWIILELPYSYLRYNFMNKDYRMLNLE